MLDQNTSLLAAAPGTVEEAPTAGVGDTVPIGARGVGTTAGAGRPVAADGGASAVGGGWVVGGATVVGATTVVVGGVSVVSSDSAARWAGRWPRTTVNVRPKTKHMENTTATLAALRCVLLTVLGALGP